MGGGLTHSEVCCEGPTPLGTDSTLSPASVSETLSTLHPTLGDGVMLMASTLTQGRYI
jgi:hypothetical protein